MTDVDPFVVPMPEKWLRDPEIEPFASYLVRWCHDMYNRTGGADDLIESQQDTEGGDPGITSGRFLEIENELDDYDFSASAPVQTFTALTKNTDYTAQAFDFIAMIKKGTIKLPANPDDNNQVIVINVNGKEVIVDGNGKNINDDTTTRSRKKNTGVVYQYFQDLDRWYMR